MEHCIINHIGQISADEWAHLQYHDNPFLSYHFLHNLEQCGVLQQHNWHPAHIVLKDKGQLQAVMPLYIKYDSYGEFVFDYVWADAYYRHGYDYYPKLVSAIPFTPVLGVRFLIHRQAENKSAIYNQLIEIATQQLTDMGCSSLHILFMQQDCHAIKDKLMPRLTYQYHWLNHSYDNFDHFLAQLTAKKRKKIRQERKKIKAMGISFEVLQGEQISTQDWEDFYRFYCAIFAKKHGEPRFNIAFFQSLSRDLPNNTLLFMAKKDQKNIAGVFAMRNHTTLYGRHWGYSDYIPFLHFELCYYQTIEYCIEHQLNQLDAGVQGEHKLARGFMPVKTQSWHYIADEQFRRSIENFLHQETSFINDHVNTIETHQPYKHDLKL